MLQTGFDLVDQSYQLLHVGWPLVIFARCHDLVDPGNGLRAILAELQ